MKNYKRSKKYLIANDDEVKTGKAVMVTTPVGDTPQEYDIEIKRICNRDMTSNENFVIKITDSRLLENCGGIVQGMSGSPIVQNGKIIGAVTHVFLNNPKRVTVCLHNIWQIATIINTKYMMVCSFLI